MNYKRVSIRYDQLKSGDQFTIRGMLHQALTDYNAETDSIKATIYKDYPYGGFNGNYDLTQLSEINEDICLMKYNV